MPKCHGYDAHRSVYHCNEYLGAFPDYCPGYLGIIREVIQSTLDLDFMNPVKDLPTHSFLILPRVSFHVRLLSFSECRFTAARP
jgi:hypothetical protein